MWLYFSDAHLFKKTISYKNMHHKNKENFYYKLKLLLHNITLLIHLL